MKTSDFVHDSRVRRPWYHPLLLARWGIILALFGYLAVGLYFFLKQNDLVYAVPTPRLSPDEASKEAVSSGLVPWKNTTPGAEGQTGYGYVPPNFAGPAPRGTIVFFHGNGDHAWLSADHVAPFTQRGFRVFFYEYPGFGGRPGVPSERAIVPEAQAVVRSLAQAGYSPIYIWGESLGAGVAAAVCADESLPIRGLTLVTPWDNIANVGVSYYPYLPVRAFMIDKYDSIANLAHFEHPICVIRGDKDDTIFPPLTLNLFAHLPEPKRMMLMKGYGHGDWPGGPGLSWWDDALNYIAPPARK